MSETTDNNAIDLNLPQLANLSAKLLDRMFVQSSKDEAKPVFKDLKNKKTILLGSITLQEGVDAELRLALDYSEFRGPGFNYAIFSAALHSILKQLSEAFRTQTEMNVLTSEEGSVLLHLPGAVTFEGQMNVMLLAFEFLGTQAITIKLMYVDPEQYEPYRQK